MMKVLLIQPVTEPLKTLQEIIERRSFKSVENVKHYFPLGVLHIGSTLEKEGINVTILDLDKKFYDFIKNNKGRDMGSFLKESLTNYIEHYKPDVIGISGNFNSNASFVQLCCKEIKAVDKDIKVVLGGHYPTNSYKEILIGDTNVDYIVLGEGENVMVDIVTAILTKNGTSLGNHPNVVTRLNCLSGVELNKRSAIIEDINILPPINYELLEDLESYITKPQDIRIIIPRKVPLRAIAMMTSRGCINNCTYCASHKVHGKKMRAFSIERVMDEMKRLVRTYDINAFIFEDDLFTYSRRRTIELCRNIYLQFNNKLYIEFASGISVKTLNEEVISWMVKAGMKQINIAIESGNQYVQDEVINKKLKLERVKPIVEILKKYDVIVRAFFIMGFPDETIEMIMDTKNFAKDLKLDWSVFSFASPIAGSKLYETAMANKQILIEDNDATTFLQFRLKSNNWKYEDIKKIQEEANIEINFLENYNLVEGNYGKSILIFENILKDYPTHLFGNYCLWKSYVGLHDYTQAKEIEEKIRKIVKNDMKNIMLLKKYNLLQEEPFKNFVDCGYE